MDFTGKNVVIAGGAGFLGTNLALALAARGARLRLTVHEKPLQQLTTTGDSSPSGIRRINTWKCPESGKTFMEIEGF